MFNRHLEFLAVVVLLLVVVVPIALHYWQFIERLIVLWVLLMTLMLTVLTFFRAAALGPVGSIGLILLIISSWPFIKSSLPLEMIAAMPYGLIGFLDAIEGFSTVAFFIGLVGFLWAFLRAIIAGKPRYYEN